MISQPNQLEVFLILDQPRRRLTHWVTVLARLAAPDVPPYLSVQAHYESKSDRAYLRLLYDSRQLGSNRLRFVQEVAELAEIKMVEPASWPITERTRFMNDRIAGCEVSVTDRRTVIETLSELARRARAAKGPVEAAKVPSMAPIAAPSSSPRSEKPTRNLAVPQPTEDLPTSPRAASDHARGSLPEIPVVIDDDLSKPIVDIEVQAMLRSQKVTARPPSPLPLPSPPTTATLRAEKSTPDETVTVADDHRKERAESVAATGSFFALEGVEPAPTTISARFLRGGRWLPARVGALSLRNGMFLSGATPRLDDQVHIALAFGDNAALVRGKVARLATSEKDKGAAGFAVNFELDAGAQQQLVTLLTNARNAKVTIKPPPPRIGRRFPVEWPVCFGTTRGAVRGDALDVSGCGMFVAPTRALDLGSNLSFSVVLDDGGAPVVGRVRVVRHVNEVDARRSSFAAGYGVAIDDLASGDAQRWAAFLTRVEKRSDRRILVGASPQRLAELSAGLGAAGYAVTGGSDAGAFVHLAESDRRPVDAAVIDPDWAGGGPSGAWLEALLGARNVPCVSTHGDARRARAVVDRLLQV
jgi:hypothetical protein